MVSPLRAIAASLAGAGQGAAESLSDSADDRAKQLRLLDLLQTKADLRAPTATSLALEASGGDPQGALGILRSLRSSGGRPSRIQEILALNEEQTKRLQDLGFFDSGGLGLEALLRALNLLAGGGATPTITGQPGASPGEQSFTGQPVDTRTPISRPAFLPGGASRRTDVDAAFEFRDGRLVKVR